MTTTTKAPKQVQAIIDRQNYIKHAKIQFSGDYARVVSQADETRAYPVRLEDGKAARCECDDFFYRGRKTGKACKHMEAVDMRIEKDAAKAARKAAKAAKSAEIVASLPVASGVKIRKVRGQNQLTKIEPKAVEPVVVASEPEVVADFNSSLSIPEYHYTGSKPKQIGGDGPIVGSTWTTAHDNPNLPGYISLDLGPITAVKTVRGRLNGCNQGFSLMR